jgi:hypothetical protein
MINWKGSGRKRSQGNQGSTVEEILGSKILKTIRTVHANEIIKPQTT